MSNIALFYAQANAVSSERHKQWCVDTGAGYAFSRNTNSIPLTAVEFEPASRHFPVVFAMSGETVFPIALVGLHDKENLFIDEAGQWDGGYLPAFVRRYPFIFAQGDDGELLTLCIDEGFAGCNQEGRGAALFDSDGRQSEYLSSILSFLGQYQAEHQRTLEFCARLKELELLEPVQANIALPSGDEFSLGGMAMVNRERFRALPDDVVAELFKSEYLALLYAHLFSLANFRTLMERAENQA